MPFATRSRDVKIRFPGIPQVLDIPSQPAQAARMDAAVNWAVRDHGHAFSLPKVEIFSGDADECLGKVRETVGKGVFGKTVLQHPFGCSVRAGILQTASKVRDYICLA